MVLDGVTQNDAIGVLVVAATRLYREGLVERLDGARGLRVAGSAAGRDEAIRLCRELRPDIVLLDMSVAQDVHAIRSLADAGVRVVAFGVSESEDVVISCAEAGVSGYVGREASLDQLVAILRAVAREEVVCSPRVAGTLLRRVGALARERGAGDGPAQRLTSRETQVVALIDEGLSNKEIAARLNIELATVKNHVHNIIEKLHVSGRGEAAARVRALGF